jgi:hypothetical protein
MTVALGTVVAIGAPGVMTVALGTVVAVGAPGAVVVVIRPGAAVVLRPVFASFVLVVASATGAFVVVVGRASRPAMAARRRLEAFEDAREDLVERMLGSVSVIHDQTFRLNYRDSSTIYR